MVSLTFVRTLPAIIALVLIAGSATHAQYSDEAFDLKQAQDLYDERGFGENAAITVDGKLVVSTSNGNVSYSYPISSFTRDGFPFTVALNYCGSVAHSSYGRYYHPDKYGSDGGGYTGWQKFSQNRPLWILGVNGFAVQTLSQTLAYHMHPRDIDTTTWENATSFEDEHVVWTVDGWDVGNRMLNFAEGSYLVPGSGGGGSTATHFRDAIRLLRSDGSVLELLNITAAWNQSSASCSFTNDGHLYSGYYVPATANTAGYARVEFTPQGDLPGYQFTKVANNACVYPRTVHYYPGDGLEYIFREYIEPYGTNYRRDSTDLFGGWYSRPTIFYLVQIRSAGMRLLDFQYSRQIGEHYGLIDRNYFRPYLVEDTTVGRALCVGFDDHRFTYSDGSMTIEAMGRTTGIQFHTVQASGYADPDAAMPMGSYGFIGDASEATARLLYNSDGLYKSWAGYVTRITDPEGRTTEFDYEPYVRVYDDQGFPRDNVTLALRNFRLKEVEEPTARYEVSYHRLEPAQIDTAYTIDTLTISSTDLFGKPMGLSNTAKQVKKYSRELNPVHLTTDNYTFTFPGTLTTDSTQPVRSNHSHVDEIADDTVSTTFWFNRRNLEWFIPWTPKHKHTSIWKTETYYRKGGKPDTLIVTTAESAVGPYLILPVQEVVSFNGREKAVTEYEYTTSTAWRTFGGDSLLTAQYGTTVTTKRTKVVRPNYGPQDAQPYITYTDEEFLHMPEFDTAVTIIDTTWDKFKMMRKYLLLDSLGLLGEDDEWEEMQYAPNIVEIMALDVLDTNYVAPPIYDLPLRTTARLPDGTVLAGSVRNYFDIGDRPAETSIAYLVDDFRLRGALIADTAVGRGQLVKVPGTLLGYTRATRGRPGTMKNALGAVSRQYFAYDVAGPYGGTPFSANRNALLKYNDDDTATITLPNTSLYANWYEVPVVAAPEVRRFSASGVLVKDTLTTLYQRTFYGLTAGVVEPNGWYSRYAYDRNGRLNTVWLPYDHQSPDSGYMHVVAGIEAVPSVGYAQYDVQYVAKDCPEGTLTIDSVEHVVFAPLHVGAPAQVQPGCPPCNDGVEKENGESATQATCDQIRSYTVRTAATGIVNFSMPHSVAGVISLDSAWVTLTATTVIGECVTVEVRNGRRPNKPLLKTFVFNCPLGTGGAGADTIIGEKATIDLTAFKDSIMGPWRGMTLLLSTSTTGGYVSFADGAIGEDTRPRLNLEGEFLKTNPLSDYTLAYEHDDANNTVDVYAKVDDSAHTANRLSGLAMLGESRRTRARHNFGADYRLLFSESFIGNPASWLRVDSSWVLSDGDGSALKRIDAENDTVITGRDGLDRPTKVINSDGTWSTLNYFECAYGTAMYDTLEYPELTEEELFYTIPCYGITVADQDFYGYVSGKTTTNENGVKFTQYFDAFERLRREVADSGGLHRITRYEYDPLGRMTRVVNPAGDTIRYWYDNLGRIRYKQQPDQGTISYAYDKLGNLRFSQTEEQARMWRMTFYEYDDLNRLRLVGETMFDTAAGGGHPPNEMGQLYKPRYDGVTGEKIGGEASLFANPVDDTLNLGRVTDLADPNILHDNGASGILTANKTLVLDPATYGKTVPQFWNLAGWNDRFEKTFTTCPPISELYPLAEPTIVYHPAPFRDTVNEYSTLSNFEHLAMHPENGRLCVHYDRLPDAIGPVWLRFPAQSIWDSVMPTLKVRNLKGREAAVAYREHAGQPYHFAVMSYDERGRVEAVARYTENVGFEVVYYTYNAMNQVTSVRLLDPFRQHVTWYGYDQNGRVDSVWTQLTNGSSWGTYGLNVGASARRPGFMAARPTNADISYAYTKTNRIDTMRYPAIGLALNYDYDRRGRMTTLVAENGSGRVFEQFLTYDAASRIIDQVSRHSGKDTLFEEYGYDNLNQLTLWTQRQSGTGHHESFTYDSVGNRTGWGWTALTGQTTTWDQLTTGRMSASATDGPNQMVELKHYTLPGVMFGREANAYDPDGSLALMTAHNQNNQLLYTEKRRWSSWRGLPFRYRKEEPTGTPGDTTKNEWEYRYNAMGEREQKRKILQPGGATSQNPLIWTYYGLSGTNAQLSVWNGVEAPSIACSNPGLGSNWVWMVPLEYLTYGGQTASIVSKPQTGGAVKEYHIADHLGSNRVTLSASGSLLKQTDYEPFGDVFAGTSDRKGFIDREHDQESDEGNFGVRQYDDEAGRFTSIDPLWEEYYSSSPFQYSLNNPLVLKDPSGLLVDFSGSSLLERQYKEVMEYFKNAGAEEAYNILHRVLTDTSFTVYLYASYQISLGGGSDNKFDFNNDIVYWNPTGASKYRNEDGAIETTSAAPALLHEVAHAYLKYVDPERLKKLDVPSFDDYGTEEEKYIILEIEFPAAKQAGEVEKPRTSHIGDSKDPFKAGTYYKAKSPTSTEPVE